MHHHIRRVAGRASLACVALLLAAATAPTQPAPRLNAPHWMQRHQDKLREVHQRPVALIFLGDSITQELENTNPAWGDLDAVWQDFYGCRQAINLGFNGDTTSSLLWRIENGEIDGISPRLAVVMVGTNNIRPAIRSSAQGTAEGIVGVVAELHRRLPATRILLLGIPPSGRPAATEQERAQVNAILAARDWAPERASFLSVDQVFLRNGAVDLSLFRQGSVGRGVVHPNAQGWRKLSTMLEPTIARLLNEPPGPHDHGSCTQR